MDIHKKWMSLALDLAQQASALGEVPVGAVICKDDELIATGYNRREIDKNGLAHAELIAINEACTKLGGWRLHQCKLYVTLEPCPMCAGAIINTRIPLVVFGASDPKAGCFGSLMNYTEIAFNHKPEIISGLMAEESSLLLKDFFKSLRSKK